MKSFRVVLAIGVLALSCAAQAKTIYLVPPGKNTCGPQSWFGQIFNDFHGHLPCTGTVSVPEPATLGLLGIGLIGLAVKRRRK
jgi:hypothetical protein